MCKWIDVNSSLPEDNVLVLVYMPYTDKKYELCKYDYGEWRHSLSCLLGEVVTHWCRLLSPIDRTNKAKRHLVLYCPNCKVKTDHARTYIRRGKSIYGCHICGNNHVPFADTNHKFNFINNMIEEGMSIQEISELLDYQESEITAIAYPSYAMKEEAAKKKEIADKFAKERNEVITFFLNENYSKAKIAKELGISRERIRQLINTYSLNTKH